ncbi:MAG: KH domain-containing protein, partial [Oscillospiraceae bacterium]
MGQKVNPHGLRVGVINKWDSNWFVRKSEMGDLILEDYKLREYVKKTLYAAGISKITIERTTGNVRLTIFCAKPGMVIGRGGDEIVKLETLLGKQTGKTVKVGIEAIKSA